MYYRDEQDQLSMEEFFLPFGGQLRKDNRWVRLAEIMPWTYIEEIYVRNMSEETGRPGISSRIAFGSLYIKAHCYLTDEETVTELQENPYMQYFVGLHEFHLETAVSILWQHVPHTSHKLPYSAKKARKSYLKLAKSKKWTQAKCWKAIGEQLNYILLATRQLEKYSALVPDANTLFPRWLRDRLAVIPVVYQQQKEMYDKPSSMTPCQLCVNGTRCKT